jgi:phosphoserine phosphatase RsbU/P
VAKRGMSISVKLITVSTLLLIIAIGVFGLLNSMQSRRIIDDATERLKKEIGASLRSAGTAQLMLLAEASRITLLQSDYSTLQSMALNLGRHELVTSVAVVNKEGTIVAHRDKQRVRQKAKGQVKKSLAVDKLKVWPDVVVGGQKSIAFSMPVSQEGTRLCTVFLALSLKPLEAQLRQAGELKAREVGKSVKNTLVVGALAVLLGVLLTIIQGLRISRPIRALAIQADHIASGDLEARVEVTSHDEIGLLGDRFNYMAEQVVVLMKETMTKATMEKELEVASAIQTTLVPDDNVAELDGINLAGYFRPATQCGGDWWSYYRMPGERVLVIIGDVTGHGVASAMITAAAKGAASTMMATTNGEIDLQELLAAMNVAIHDAAKGRFVMTCFASIFDSRTRTLSYANAGHNFPYVIQAATGKLISLVIRGNRLGDVSGSHYEVKQQQLEPDDAVIWYTDGIVECEDVRGDEYGERRFRSVIRKNGALPVDELRDALVERAGQFFGEVPQKDDITLVVGRVS